MLHQMELQEVVDRPRELKSEKCYATFSEIILRADKPDLNKKRKLSQCTLKSHV